MGVRTATIIAVLAAALASSAAAQPQPFSFAPAGISTGTATSSATVASLGAPLSVDGGPWVLAETLFFSQGKVLSDYAWRGKLRGVVGQLYARDDLQHDADTLKDLKVFSRIKPSVYAIPNNPIPPQFTSISVSTLQVRVVFDVDLAVSTGPAVRLITPPSAVSGLILTPTAFRGAGRFNTPGLGLDFNAVYFIGRLYGKNNYANAPEKTNYLDRVGLWTMTADGKMQLQSDGFWRPAVAVGAQTMFVFRDSPQPNVTAPTGTVQVNAKSTQILTDAYIVASKDIKGVRTSVGLMEGNVGNLVSNLSEFLSPAALQFYNNEPANTVVTSRTLPFFSMFYMLKPDYPIGFEVIKYDGAASNPMLIDMKIGRFLKLNFDLAYLKFSGGYDLLGIIAFRFNEYPSR